MGRSFESVRMGAKEVSARWLKASRALKKEDRIYGQKLAEMVKKQLAGRSKGWLFPSYRDGHITSRPGKIGIASTAQLNGNLRPPDLLHAK
jgi:hypothetical protein